MTIIATYLSMFAADDSFHAIQIECDQKVSCGAFVFVDKCKSLNLLDNRTSCIATKYEEQHIFLMQQKLFG